MENKWPYGGEAVRDFFRVYLGELSSLSYYSL